MTIDVEKEWRVLLALEENARDSARDIGNDRKSTKKQRADASRAWWSAVNAVLLFYVRGPKDHGFTLKPMPADVITHPREICVQVLMVFRIA